MRESSYILIDACFGKEFKQFELPKGPETEEGMIKWEDFLYSHLTACWLVHGCHNSPVRTLADGMQKFVIVAFISVVNDYQDRTKSTPTGLELGEGLGGFTRRHTSEHQNPAGGGKKRGSLDQRTEVSSLSTCCVWAYHKHAGNMMGI